MRHAKTVFFLVSAGVSAAVWSCVSDTSPPPDGGGTDSSTTDVTSPPTDAGKDTSSEAEAGAACDPLKQFATPQPMTALNNGGDQQGARLWSDNLTLYYHTANDAGLTSVHTSVRPSPSAAFPPGTALDLGGQSAFPTLTSDGLTIMFESTRGGGAGGVDLFQIKRASTSVAFAGDAATPLASLNTTQNEGRPFLRGDGSEVYYITRYHPPDAGGATDTDLYRAVITGGNVGPPIELNSINTAVNEYAVVVTPDGLLMYFARNDDGGVDYDIWSASRKSTSNPWSNHTKVAELNSLAAEIPTWISADGCTIYISSTRGDGGYDLYSAQRPP